MRFGTSVELFSVRGVPMAGNAETGCVVGLTPSGAALCRLIAEGNIAEDQARSAEPELIEALATRGFFEDPHSGPRLSSAYLHVTQRCNLDCAGCYSLDAQRNRTPDPSFEQVRFAIDGLAKCGVRKLAISGGEPFLRDDLPDIVRYAASDAGIAQVTVLTNGTCVSAAAAHALAPHVAAVSVSLDGCSPDDPAPIRRAQRFDTIMEAVSTLQEAGIPTSLLPTIHARNVGDIPRYRDLAARLGAGLSFSLLSCPAGDADLADLRPTDESLHELARTLRESNIALHDAPIGAGLTYRRSCEAGTRLVSIAADGSVYPCHLLHGAPFFMGNAFEEPLPAIVERRAGLPSETLDPRGFEECGDCTYRPFCGGGCRARAINEGRGATAPDPYCTLMRTHYAALMDDLLEKIG